MKNNRNIFFIVLVLSIICSVGLLLFTFTQVDLSLTLSQKTVFQTVQQQFQYVGFYQRPTATVLYLLLLLLMIVLYGISLYAVKKGVLKERRVWILILVTMSILFFSYPAAFSYDIFNYIFTAKTILLYKQNPYVVKPLDFQGIDPMLSFMRWTHLPSAYTPVWMLMTFIPYIISFGSLSIVIWTMKIIPMLFYLLTIWLIGNILQKVNPSHRIFGMVAFALNPLVIIEVLVSAHNDIVMMGFALLAYTLYLDKKNVFSFFVFALSVATKLITVALFPLFFVNWSVRKALVLLLGVLLLVLLRRELLQWYMLWIIPFAVLIPNTRLLILLVGVSVGLLLKYAPLFYYGIDPQITNIQNVLLISCIAISGLFAATKK